MADITQPKNIADTDTTASTDDQRSEARESMVNRITPGEAKPEKETRKGLSSMWGKAKDYASKAADAASKRARKVQTRSTKMDATRAAEKAERVAAGISATLTGLTKTTVAGAVGFAKGTFTGTIRGTQPAFVKALHAADDIALAGSWTGSVEQVKPNDIRQDVAFVDLDDDVAEVLGMQPQDTLPLGRAVETVMDVAGSRTDVIATPIWDKENGKAIGCLVLEFDDAGDDRVFLHLDQ